MKKRKANPSRQERRLLRTTKQEQERKKEISDKLLPFLHPEKVCEYFAAIIVGKIKHGGEVFANPLSLHNFIAQWHKYKKKVHYDSINNIILKTDYAYGYLEKTNLVKGKRETGLMITGTGYHVAVDVMKYHTQKLAPKISPKKPNDKHPAKRKKKSIRKG